eukprot:m.134720 g.134720  ORF g.134720 m.134720 type:complete len:656 (+) comp15977_c0_seq3:71-2038(+)
MSKHHLQADDDDDLLTDAFDLSAPNEAEVIDALEQDDPASFDLERLSDSGTNSFKEELYHVLAIVWPVVLTMLLQLLFQMVSVVFVGQYDSTAALDAAGLGVSFLNVFGFSVGNGLASAVDTLAAQAYGSNNKLLLGLILQRGIYIVGLSCLPAWAIYLNAEPFLLAIGQDPKVAQLTARFLSAVMLYLPGMLLYILLQKYLQAMNIVKPALYIGLVVNILNIPLCWLLIASLRLGVVGAAVCQVLCAWLMALGTLVYIWRSGIAQEAWPGWRAAALLEWWPFLRLALPGMFMLCIEWWSFEIAQFLAGLMGEVQLATQLITLQVAAFAFMVPLGISVAASIRVGNYLGANDPVRAKRVALACMACVFATSLCSAVVVYSSRRHLPRAFTADEKVVDAVAAVLLLVGVFQLFDHTQGVLSGILRGCGLQLYGAAVNVVGYYVIAAPVLGVAAFVAHLEVKGLWVGLICGVAFQAVALGLRVYRIDWVHEAAQAVARSNPQASHGTSPGDKTAHDDVAMLSLDPDDDDTEALLDQISDGEQNSSWLNLSLKDISWRIKKQQLFAAAVLLLIFILGLTTSVTYDKHAVCYPLPAVGNASKTCHGKSSLIAGHNCSTTCHSGWVASGDFVCGHDGNLTSVPLCLRNTSEDQVHALPPR